MRIAYFDCVGGVSGDMLLSALLDAGASRAVLQSVAGALRLSDCTVKVENVMRGALSAKLVNVITPRQQIERHPADLLSLIDEADLSIEIKNRAKKMIDRIAQAEAKIHNCPLDTLHLHEVGGDDTLIDIVGVLKALEELQIERVYTSPLPLARGMTTSMHGLIPLPAPATLALLRDVPVRYLQDVETELVTPTGAAIITSLVDDYEGVPLMQIETVGTGAGSRELPFPNVVRVIIGTTNQAREGVISETLSMLETNIDDVNPQVYEHVMNCLFDAGALDVTLTSLQMKKNRTGNMLSVLCYPNDAEEMQTIIFREGITLGVRHTTCQRVCLPRTIEAVETPFGTIHVKISRLNGMTRAVPEYEDCLRAAETFEVPLLKVMASTREACSSKLSTECAGNG